MIQTNGCLAMMSLWPLIGSCCSRCLDAELQDVRRCSYFLTSLLLQTSRLRRSNFLVTRRQRTASWPWLTFDPLTDCYQRQCVSSPTSRDPAVKILKAMDPG